MRETADATTWPSLDMKPSAPPTQTPPIVKTNGVCGGDACIRGTRLTVWGLVEYRQLGWNDARILEAYPQLSQDDLEAVWEYAAAHPDEIASAIRENGEA